MMIRCPFSGFLILLLHYCGLWNVLYVQYMRIEYWCFSCLILSKYVPNICQMAITVTSISDKDDVSCESSNSWYFRVSYLRSMHTSQEHSGLMGFKNFVQKFQDYFAAKVQKKSQPFSDTILTKALMKYERPKIKRCPPKNFLRKRLHFGGGISFHFQLFVFH